MPAPLGQSVRNKANSRAGGNGPRPGKGAGAVGGTELHKQSQLAPDRLEAALGGAGNAADDGANVRNKPNFSPLADAMDLEYATVCRPHPLAWPANPLFEFRGGFW